MSITSSYPRFNLDNLLLPGLRRRETRFTASTPALEQQGNPRKVILVFVSGNPGHDEPAGNASQAADTAVTDLAVTA